MADMQQDRWERARRGVLDRWSKILGLIEAHDEPGILALANVMDEFCEEAILVREASAGRYRDAAGPALKILTSAAPAGSRCLFCRGFLDVGGCFGLLDNLNQAVMKGHWDYARDVAENYIRRLGTLNFSAGDRSRVH